MRDAARLALCLLAVGCEAAHTRPPVDACVPRTCEAMGTDCGEPGDGCGGTLDCGACTAPTACGAIVPNVCGIPCTVDADCAPGEWCDSRGRGCSTGCRTGTEIALVIPRVSTRIEVTLNGEPLPTYPLLGGAGPRIVLARPGEASGMALSLYDPLYDTSPGDDRGPGVPRTIELVPGEYDVFYVGATGWPAPWPTSGDDPWGGPAEHLGARVGHVVVDDDPGVVTIDVPSVRLDVTITLDGGPLAAPEPFPSPPAAVEIGLRGDRGGRTSFEVCTFGDFFARIPASCDPSHEVWLVPDRYSVTYGAQNAGAFNQSTRWPAGTDAIISSLDVTTALTATIDIPRVEVRVEPTLGSRPLEPTPATPGEIGPRVVFERIEGGVTDIVFFGYESGGAWTPWVNAPFAMLPGTYETRLIPPRIAGWPEVSPNLGRVTFSDDTTFAFDVAPVELTLTVTANGVASAEACLALVVEPAPGGEGAEIRDVSSTSSVFVMPGTYVINYYGGDCPPPWPRVAFVERDEPVEVIGDTSVAFDLATVHVVVDLTLGGLPLPPRPASGYWRPSIFLRSTTADPSGGPTTGFWPYGRPEGVVSHFDVWMPRGSYDAILEPLGPAHAVDWPAVPVMLLAALDLSTDRTLAIDVGRTRVRVSASVAGSPTVAPVAASEPAITLVHDLAVDDYTVDAPRVLLFDPDGVEDVLVTSPEPLWLVPGRYSITYDAGPTADGAPGGSASLGCWIVP